MQGSALFPFFENRFISEKPSSSFPGIKSRIRAKTLPSKKKIASPKRSAAHLRNRSDMQKRREPGPEEQLPKAAYPSEDTKSGRAGESGKEVRGLRGLPLTRPTTGRAFGRHGASKRANVGQMRILTYAST